MRLYITILPILLLLTACNDSNDGQQEHHDGVKPVMRCAP